MKQLRAIRKRAALLCIAILIAFGCIYTPSLSASAAGKTYTVSVSGVERYSLAYEVLNLLNAQRRSHGLSELTMDKSLLNTAMLRAAESVISFSHTRPNGTECFTAYNWSGCVGENIAVGQVSANQVMESWLNSDGHRKNILNESYKKVGIGCVSVNGVLYWVQSFSGGTATPVSKPANKKVTRNIKVTSDYKSAYIPNRPTIKTCSVGLKSATIKYGKVSGATSYRIYRYNPSSKKYEAIATIGANKLRYTDKDLTPGVSYTYKVRAYKKVGGCNGWSDCSPSVKVTPKPSKPTIQSYSTTTDSITLNWNTVSCTGYHVYRLNSSKQKYELIGTVRNGTTSFTDTDRQSDRSYRYRVNAYYATASGIYAVSPMSGGVTIRTK